MKDLTTDEITWNGTTYRTILSTEATGGAMSITDSTTPAGEGPPLHVHAAEDEIFVVLTGEMEFMLDGVLSRQGPGGAVFIPRGHEHTYRVSSDTPSRHLVILTPGGFEGFFADMAANGYRIPDDMGPITESAARHNLTFTGPPIAAM